MAAYPVAVRVPNRAIMSFIQAGVLSANDRDLYFLEEDLQTLFHCVIWGYFDGLWHERLSLQACWRACCVAGFFAYARKGGARFSAWFQEVQKKGNNWEGIWGRIKRIDSKTMRLRVMERFICPTFTSNGSVTRDMWRTLRMKVDGEEQHKSLPHLSHCVSPALSWSILSVNVIHFI